MSKALDVFPVAVSEYLADTQHLSTVQHGAYLLLLFTMRRAGGWVDDDDQKLARIVRLSLDKWRKIAPGIRELLVSEGGCLSQKRILADLEKQTRLSSKNASNGRTGGVAKSLKNNNPDVASATISPEVRQPFAKIDDVLPISLKEEKKESKKDSGRKEDSEKRRQPGACLANDWRPSEEEIAYGERLGMTRQQVLNCGEDMRLWAVANSNQAKARKSNWSAAFQGWLRREAPRIVPRNGTSGGSNGKAQGYPTRTGFAGLAARLRHGTASIQPDAGNPTADQQPPHGR